MSNEDSDAGKRLPRIHEHTPEPWFINGSLITSGRFDGDIVAETRLDIGPEWYANAKLLRAAPSMLRMLRGVADELVQLARDGDIPQLRETAKEIGKAIADLDGFETWVKADERFL